MQKLGQVKGIMVNKTTRRIRVYTTTIDTGFDMIPVHTNKQQEAIQAIMERAMVLVGQVISAEVAPQAILANLKQCEVAKLAAPSDVQS